IVAAPTPEQVARQEEVNMAEAARAAEQEASAKAIEAKNAILTPRYLNKELSVTDGYLSSMALEQQLRDFANEFDIDMGAQRAQIDQEKASEVKDERNQVLGDENLAKNVENPPDDVDQDLKDAENLIGQVA